MHHTEAWSAVCYPDKIIFKNTLMSILPIIQGKSQRNSQFPLRPWCKLFYNNQVHKLGYFKSVFYRNVMIKVNCATCITFQDVNQSLVVCISYNCTWKNRHQLFLQNCRLHIRDLWHRVFHGRPQTRECHVTMV